MASTAENLARVVIYDPVTQNLRATRYGLYEAGFREIEGFSEMGELRRRVEDGPVDLLVADADDSGTVFNLVQKLRQGDLGTNPFSVVFLTSWRSDPAVVGHALKSGADDVIVRPFSTNFMEARVRTVVDNRKKFVVTSDYLGPDRRTDPERASPSQVRLFEPPNTLKSAIKGDAAALEANAAAVEACKDAVRRERAVRLAVRMGVEVELAMAGQRPVSAIHAMAKELYAAVDMVEPEAARLAGSIVRRLASGEDIERGLKLARELSLGICVICSDEGAADQGRYVAEIEGLVGRLKSRGEEAA